MINKMTAIISILALTAIGICFYFYNCRGKISMITENSITKPVDKFHQKLFLEHKSELKETDAEFIALFDNFAFNEVTTHSNLDLQTRIKIILASTIATQSLSEYKIMVKVGLNNDVTPVEIKEIAYQAVPYLGISKVYDFLIATNHIFKEAGIALPLPNQATTTPETRFDKGLAQQKAIFGEHIDNMRQNAPKNQKHIQDYLSANCFGDYYTRNGLDIKTRELLTFAMLVSLGGADNQVKGHIQGNLNVGNDKQILIDAVTQLLPFIGYPRTLNALAALNEIVPEK